MVGQGLGHDPPRHPPGQGDRVDVPRLRLAEHPAHRPLADRHDDALEVSARRGELVLVAASVGQVDPLDHALALEVVQALLEERARDAGETAVDLVEPSAAEHELAHDQGRPSLRDDGAGQRDRAVLRVVLHQAILGSVRNEVQNLVRRGPVLALEPRDRRAHPRKRPDQDPARRSHDHDLRSHRLQEHDARPVGDRSRGVEPMGPLDRELARARHRGDARQRPPRARLERSRRRRRVRRAEPGSGATSGADRAGPGHRHLTGHPRLRRGGCGRGGPDERGDPRDRRRGAVQRGGRGKLRRGHLARGADLLPQPAPGPHRDLRRPPARRSVLLGRVLDGRPQRLLRHPGGHHPPDRRPAGARAWASRPVQPGCAGGRGVGVRRRRHGRRHRHRGAVAGAHGERGRVRAVRARVVRGPAPDALRRRRRPAGRRLARDRGCAHPVRGPRGVRRALRDARRVRHAPLARLPVGVVARGHVDAATPVGVRRVDPGVVGEHDLLAGGGVVGVVVAGDGGEARRRRTRVAQDREVRSGGRRLPDVEVDLAERDRPAVGGPGRVGEAAVAAARATDHGDHVDLTGGEGVDEQVLVGRGGEGVARERDLRAVRRPGQRPGHQRVEVTDRHRDRVAERGRRADLVERVVASAGVRRGAARPEGEPRAVRRPGGLGGVAETGDLLLARSVRVHHPDVPDPGGRLADVGDPLAVRRPVRSVVLARRRQLPDRPTGGRGRVDLVGPHEREQPGVLRRCGRGRCRDQRQRGCQDEHDQCGHRPSASWVWHDESPVVEECHGAAARTSRTPSQFLPRMLVGRAGGVKQRT